MKRYFGFNAFEGNGKYGFISYKSEDENLVAPYTKALHNKGVMLWYDYGIPAGEDWFQTISKKIVESSFMILFVTERVFRSSVIHTEIKTAEMWDIPVVPVFVEKINRNNIPNTKASLLAKVSLMQGVDKAWNMNIKETTDSIYELIAPMLDADTKERIQLRGKLLERQVSANPPVFYPMIQNALSEIHADEVNREKHNNTQSLIIPISPPNKVSSQKYIPQKDPHITQQTTLYYKSNYHNFQTKFARPLRFIDNLDNTAIVSISIVFVSIALISAFLISIKIKSLQNYNDNEYDDTEYQSNAYNSEYQNHESDIDYSDTFEYEIHDSKITITGIKNSSSSTFEIPNKINNIPVTEIDEDVFWYWSKLETIIVSDDNKYFCTIDGVLFNKNRTELIKFPRGQELKTYVVPDSVTSIASNAFRRSLKLTQIVIPNSVTSIGICAFADCYELTQISFSDSVNTIGESSFIGCKKLKKITVATGNEHFCDINGVLFNKKQTELVRYPSDFETTSYSVPSSVKKICAYAFEGCIGLTQIKIPGSVTEIGKNAFYGCGRLSSIRMTPSIATLDLDQYDTCVSLKKLIIPEPNKITGWCHDGNIIPFSHCKDLTIYGGTTAKDLAEDYNIPYVAQ